MEKENRTKMEGRVEGANEGGKESERELRRKGLRACEAVSQV